MIKITRSDDAPIHIGDPTEPNPKSIKFQSSLILAVVEAVMVVTVKRLGHTKAACQFVNGFKSMWMRTGSFVRHQNV
nr:hypothetical protein [uncultured Ottowia sp.]